MIEPCGFLGIVRKRTHQDGVTNRDAARTANAAVAVAMAITKVTSVRRAVGIRGFVPDGFGIALEILQAVQIGGLDGIVTR